ncbi:MAG: transcriptional regulator [Desulfobacteraceae bacterium]|nr:transcriptional regulator [Desulfobacteraceae bacterium]
MPVERELLKAVASIDDLDELEQLFEEILTPAELADLSLRWKLLTDLHRGMTQRKIAEKYRISLCKITRGSKILKQENSMVLKILKRDTNSAEKGDTSDTEK